MRVCYARYAKTAPTSCRCCELHPELKLRVVPFKDITGSKSFVYAFKPEKITDIDKNTDIERMLVGIIGTQLSAEGAFNALLHSKV